MLFRRNAQMIATASYLLCLSSIEGFGSTKDPAIHGCAQLEQRMKRNVPRLVFYEERYRENERESSIWNQVVASVDRMIGSNHRVDAKRRYALQENLFSSEEHYVTVEFRYGDGNVYREEFIVKRNSSRTWVIKKRNG